MTTLFQHASVYTDGTIIPADVLVVDGVITAIGQQLAAEGAVVIDCSGKYLFPGFVDVHVHLREPGFSYKETIATGTLAAAHGGYTTVFSMPNLNPAPDSAGHLEQQLSLIRQNARVRVLPYGTITIGEKGETLADMAAMAENVPGFSDDGRGVQSEEMMLAAMEEAKRLGKPIVAHCEDNSLLRGGYIHDGEYAAAHGHPGICSESEWGPIKRDLELVRKTGCRYHICHMSAAESVALLREAKAEGLPVSGETAPHYLTMNDGMLREEGRFKMNPPIRSERDRLALLEGILDGTIEAIATDHAPHSAEEKSRGLKDSPMGVVGLECSFAILYTKLVRPGILSLEQLVALMSDKPRKLFGLPEAMKVGAPADMTLFDLNADGVVDPETFLSMGKSTPFAGEKINAECLMTIVGGEIVWNRA